MARATKPSATAANRASRSSRRPRSASLHVGRGWKRATTPLSDSAPRASGSAPIQASPQPRRTASCRARNRAGPASAEVNQGVRRQAKLGAHVAGRLNGSSRKNRMKSA